MKKIEALSPGKKDPSAKHQHVHQRHRKKDKSVKEIGQIS